MIPHSKPSIGQEELDAVSRVLRSGHIAQGVEVAAFEEACAAFLNRRYAVAVNSGTSALHLALGALGVAPGEPIALPSYACAALMTAVHLQQATPRLCDIGPDYNLDVNTVPASCRVTIVPHLFGAPARLPEGCITVEDIAQSIGGETGRAGVVAVASFYATKLLTTGEGGMVLTDDEGLAAYARERRDYDNRDDCQVRYPYKMTDFQAALGRVQLGRLPEFIARRRAIAVRYQEAFRDSPLRLPCPARHVFFRYVIATPGRDALEAFLVQRGIEGKRPVYRPGHHFIETACPRAEAAHRECLSLPIYPELLETETTHVIDSVRAFFDRFRSDAGSGTRA